MQIGSFEGSFKGFLVFRSAFFVLWLFPPCLGHRSHVAGGLAEDSFVFVGLKTFVLESRRGRFGNRVLAGATGSQVPLVFFSRP